MSGAVTATGDGSSAFPRKRFVKARTRRFRGNAISQLLAARDQATSVTELAELMGMTKQAASKLVGAMVSAGYIQRGTDPQDGRQRPVTLTGRGEELLSAVEQVYAELEDGWAKLIGPSHLDRMRRDLMRILSDPGTGQLPPVRPTW